CARPLYYGSWYFDVW
nr:immunoglobulin heavy chain junction region [Mus musculus]NSM06764.1 immunoglobulin heavy chain junction region [Mus musculus]NSM06852.1 immunoglobulin heavy chain junction region [Mus musculus]NSM08257.1 immunoglobulin heavy chain junction region [Mus musculus]NSM09110.1 immunoglobulin heavy chain junction region [Mus musculus]